MSVIFIDNLNQHRKLFAKLDVLLEPVSSSAKAVAESLRSGGKLLICGNGGSAGDSQHIAAEFTGRFVKDREPIAAIALSTDTSALTCIANDYSFDEVFSRQVRALGKPGDCLLAITTSGNSGNVLTAIAAANKLGITTIGLLGRDGGKAAALCNIAIIVPSDVTARRGDAGITS